MDAGSIVLCGLGRVGWRVLQSLQATGASVTVVTLHGEESDPRLNGAKLVLGDCTKPEVLKKAGVPDAAGVIIVTSEDLVNITAAMQVRKLNGTARLVVRMFNQNLIAKLSSVVKNTVAMSVSALTAPLMALTAVVGESLAAFSIGTIPQQIVRLQIGPDSPLVGRDLQGIASEFHVLVLGHIPASGVPKMLGEVDGKDTLQPGDRVVLGGSPNRLQPLLSEPDDAKAAKRGGPLGRILRTVRLAIGEIDMPVKITSIALFATLLASTLVFRFGIGKEWAEGFYSSVSIVATGAELHGEGKDGWIQVFLAGLKLAGAALIATFTALLTNYLLKARLAGVFETHRIPESGHVVVCGLGNVGYRCVLELLKLGAKVVAIERSKDSTNTETVRRMGVSVISGDATMLEVLKQANAPTARAVIAATSDELANLEIALQVGNGTPNRRIVVRLSDPDFAQAARDAAEIRYAMSPPALAAPAFAAALLGDRIHSLVYAGQRSFAIVELVAEDGDTITGQSIGALKKSFGLIPLGLGDALIASDAAETEERIISVGDRLTTMIELDRLEKLIVNQRRRETPAAANSDG